MEKKKDILIKVLFIIIIALCIVIGYIRYTDTKKEQPKDNDKQVVTNDFYKAENLVTNGYLVKKSLTIVTSFSCTKATPPTSNKIGIRKFTIAHPTIGDF